MSKFLHIAEIFGRWVFYVMIVVISIVLLRALQVRQQIKAFDDFRDYAEHANQITVLGDRLNRIEYDLIEVDGKIANWSWYKEDQHKELEQAIKILKQTYTSNDLEDPGL